MSIIVDIERQTPQVLSPPIAGVCFQRWDRTIRLFGSSYNNASHPKLEGAYKIKLAREIRAPHHIALDIEDFSTPSMVDTQRVMYAVVASIPSYPMLFCGCMGGKGRTGLFMAIFAKVMGVTCPVTYIRRHYTEDAVETPLQMEFVDAFDPLPYQRLLAAIFKDIQGQSSTTSITL